MGQKAKNAGKKQSKTCNKKANAKSICGGGWFKAVTLTPIQKLELQIMDVGRNSTYVKGVGHILKTNRTPVLMG